MARYIIMWSGPRNISTAMMRAWESRGDTSVCDEPFYAHYLDRTGLPHPGREKIIARHETEPARIIDQLAGPIPGGKDIFFQKHMAHHLTDEVDLGWLDQMTNWVLIRDPREMIPSLLKRVPDPGLMGTALPRQIEIVNRIRRLTGHPPPIVDARDVLENPRRMLEALCESVGIPFTERMLAWPVGKRSTDGAWAEFWYDVVEESTGFQPYRPRDEPIPDQFRGLCDQCLDLYHQLYSQRLRP